MISRTLQRIARKMLGVFIAVLFLGVTLEIRAEVKPIVIGSKIDVEGRLLGELFAQLLEDRGFKVERRFALGGTSICFEALKRGAIDVYPEYSGTLERSFLELSYHAPFDELQQKMKEQFHLEALSPLGFNNTYALAVNRDLADQHQLRRLSDLGHVKALRYGLSPEFLNWGDWEHLTQLYRLAALPVSIDHGLAYEALAERKIDVIDAYSTDGRLIKYNLVVLDDDQKFFPLYLAMPLVREELDARAKEVLLELAGTLSDARMQSLNAMVELDRKSFAETATTFLRSSQLLRSTDTPTPVGRWRLLLSRTFTHIFLVMTSLGFAILVSLPLGIAAYRWRKLSKIILSTAGMLQTIPSIALLALMIPLLGIGVWPALAALFLYALLPIIQNTATALFSIDPVLKLVSMGMGLTLWQRLRLVELPLAFPTIMAGIRTAAVINVGTATLAAFIGAGGLGESIVTGLALNDTSLILEGAIPAALLALGTEYFFERLEKRFVPKHLLQKMER